jgi:hypothetical protein
MAGRYGTFYLSECKTIRENRGVIDIWNNNKPAAGATLDGMIAKYNSVSANHI